MKITLTGSNDLPTIVSATAIGDVNEKAEPAEGGTLSDTGTITFADVDLSDTHSATVSATVKDENGNTVTSPLGALTLGTVDQTANNVGWTFSVNDSVLDFLAQGETRILSSAHFASNAGGTATDNNDYILFDTSTGNLYYDPDGNGGQARVLIATLTVTAGTIDPTDFLII